MTARTGSSSGRARPPTTQLRRSPRRVAVGRLSRHRATVAATALLVSGCGLRGAMAPRGVEADIANGLWWYMFWLATAIFVGWLALFGVGLVRRHRTDASEADDARIHRRFIVGGGLVLPAIALGSLFFANLGALNALPSGDDVVIDATAYQYWWEFGYAQPGFVTANEMYIPTGTDVRVRLRTNDVIHSFWVPQVSGKRDMVPGRVNELTLHARQPGRYLGECTEFCGLQHANMRFEVVAVAPDAYRQWLRDMARPAAAPDTAAERAGYDAFMGSTCASCHAIDGTPADGRQGPALTHFAARERLGAGAAPNDRGHLAGWVVNSQALKPGNPMPPIEIQADELSDLLTYLESLE
jgi:cytochrome c oxidase subunit II